MLAASFVAFLSSNQFATLKLAFNFWDPFAISQYRLSRLSVDEYKAAIEDALSEDDIDEAKIIVEIAQENGYVLPDELVNKTNENGIQYTFRYSKNFLYGVITGEIENWPSFMGCIASDLTLIGDVRDVMIHGSYFLQGEEYESLTLGMSLLGVATSVASISPAAPVTVPADVGISIIKNTNKIRKLSKPLTRHISRISSKLINTNGLKDGLYKIKDIKFKAPSLSKIRSSFSRIDWQAVSRGDLSKVKVAISEIIPIDYKYIKNAFKHSIRNDVADEAKILATAIGGVASSGGLKAAMRVMEHADDIKDISKFQKLTVKMVRKSSSVIKILGKGAIKLGKLLYLVISILVAVLGWLIGALWFLYSVIRTTYHAAKRVKAAI